MRLGAATLGLLFIALCHSSLAQSAGAGEVEVAVAAGAPLEVTCALRVEERAEWRRDGAPPPPDMRASEQPAAGGLTARLEAPAARAHHAGRYTCSPRARPVRVRVLAAPAPAGPEATSEPPAAAPAPAPDADGDWLDHSYNIFKQLQLNCSAGDGVDVSGVTFTWLVNGSAPEQTALRGRVKLAENGARLTVERALEDDYGNYTCLAGGRVALRWRVAAVHLLRLNKDHNVVDGQKVKLTCRVVGKPYPAVRWLRVAAEGDRNGTDALEFLGERARAQASPAGVPGGELVLEAAQRGDAGLFACTAPGVLEPAYTTLRVKDMYAALWPFLGICAEVFVLCAIILVYEKRRTKPECDDSDTDNHDQKKS